MGSQDGDNEVYVTMQNSSSNFYPPSMPVHNLIDKLCALVNRTDLLIETVSEDSTGMKHVREIRTIAKSVLQELVQVQSDLASERASATSGSIGRY